MRFEPGIFRSRGGRLNHKANEVVRGEGERREWEGEICGLRWGGRVQYYSHQSLTIERSCWKLAILFFHSPSPTSDWSVLLVFHSSCEIKRSMIKQQIFSSCRLMSSPYCFQHHFAIRRNISLFFLLYCFFCSVLFFLSFFLLFLCFSFHF